MMMFENVQIVPNVENVYMQTAKRLHAKSIKKVQAKAAKQLILFDGFHVYFLHGKK